MLGPNVNAAPPYYEEATYYSNGVGDVNAGTNIDLILRVPCASATRIDVFVTSTVAVTVTIDMRAATDLISVVSPITAIGPGAGAFTYGIATTEPLGHDYAVNVAVPGGAAAVCTVWTCAR